MGGDYWRHNLLRKLFRPFVHRYLTMSRNLQEWLVGVIGVEPARVAQIYSGVDTVRFAPHRSSLRAIAPAATIRTSGPSRQAIGRFAAYGRLICSLSTTCVTPSVSRARSTARARASAVATVPLSVTTDPAVSTLIARALT